MNAAHKGGGLLREHHPHVFTKTRPSGVRKDSGGLSHRAHGAHGACPTCRSRGPQPLRTWECGSRRADSPTARLDRLRPFASYVLDAATPETPALRSPDRRPARAVS